MSERARVGQLWRLARLLAVIVVVLLGFWALGRLSGPWIERFALWASGLGAWAPLAFIAGYALATVAGLPGVLFTLVAGVLFGVTEGTVYVFVGSTSGACIAFALGRTLFRGSVERWLAKRERFERLDFALEQSGLKVVTLLRLSPILPFNLLNYGLSLTRVRFRDYALGSFGMIPWTAVYVYLGSAGRTLATPSALRGERDWSSLSLELAGLLITLWISVALGRIARRELERTAPPRP